MMTSLGNVISLLDHLNCSTSKYTPTVYDVLDVEDVRQDSCSKLFSYTEVLEHKSVWQSVHGSTVRLFLGEVVDAEDEPSKDLTHQWTTMQGSQVQTHHCTVSQENPKQQQQQEPTTYSIIWRIRKATGPRVRNAMGVPGMGGTDMDLAYLTDSQYRAANGLPEISREAFGKPCMIDVIHIPLSSNARISSFCIDTGARGGGGSGATITSPTEAAKTGGDGSVRMIYR